MRKLKYMPVLLAASLVITSCGVVTKSYKQPENLTDKQLYRDAGQDTASLGALPWNQLFKDEILQKLIQEGLEQNLNLKTAIEKINESKATLGQSKLALLPSLDAFGNVTRNKLSKQATQATDLYSTTWKAGLSASWEIDIWGKLSSAKRSALAALLQKDAAKRAVQTEIIAGIANYYYTLLALDEQLAITRETVAKRTEDVATMKTLKESAVVNGAAVVQSQANLYSAQVTIPDIEQSIRETENALSILLNRVPGTIERGKLAGQEIAVDPKAGMPGDLLKNRPDVVQAEMTFRQAFESVNIAKSRFYPSLSITADAGLSALKLKDFFDNSLFYTLVGGITQPIFNQGQNRANLKIAQAQQKEAFYSYRQTILTAGKEVSDALFAYKTALAKEGYRTGQITALEKSVDFTKELLRYSSSTNYTDVLTSEQSLLSAQLSSVNDKLAKLQSIVTLYKALGGGAK